MRAFCARKIHCGGKNGNPIRMRYPCPAAQRPHRTHTIAQKPMGHTGRGWKSRAGCAPKKRGERVQARPLMKGNQYGYHTCRQNPQRREDRLRRHSERNAQRYGAAGRRQQSRGYRACFGPFRQHDGHPDDAFESGGQGVYRHRHETHRRTHGKASQRQPYRHRKLCGHGKHRRAAHRGCGSAEAGGRRAAGAG